MFIRGKSLRQRANTLQRKIDFFLKSNFMTRAELAAMSPRAQVKVIKLTARIEGLKLSTKESREILNFALATRKSRKVTNAVKSLFAFVSDLFSQVIETVKNFVHRVFSFVFNFRTSLMQVLRI